MMNDSSDEWRECHLVKAADNILTYLPLDKMVTILQMMFSNAFSWMKHSVVVFFIKISLKFVPKGSTDDNLALV